jgi:hypothetical protein
MKINQKQLNEMIRKSILKRLNEDVQGTSDDLQSRMDKIKWYFETPTYLMKNRGKQNQEEVENGTGRRTELKNAYTRWKNENYIDADFIKFNFYNRSLEFIPSEIDEPADEPAVESFHQPTESIAVNSDTLTLKVECQISQTQMEQMVADFVRVFGIKAVLNAATSHIN